MLPIHTTEKFRGKSRAGLFGDVMQTIDFSVGQVIETLRKTGNENNNLDIGPSERYNRAEEKPELVEQLAKLMRKMAEEVGVKAM